MHLFASNYFKPFQRLVYITLDPTPFLAYLRAIVPLDQIRRDARHGVNHWFSLQNTWECIIVTLAPSDLNLSFSFCGVMFDDLFIEPEAARLITTEMYEELVFHWKDEKEKPDVE